MRRRYQQDAYYAGEGYDNYAEQSAALDLTYRLFVRSMRRRGLVGGRLLEVGCGFGHFLAACADAFAYRAGTEMSAAGTDRAATVADVVYQGGVDAVPNGETFDVVVAMQVVEHVYDPVSFVHALRDRLRPGGVLVLATPDAGGLLCRTTGRRWPSFKIPEHVTYFDERTLRELFSRAGFVPTRIPLVHAFPMGLIFRRLGLRVPARLATLPILIPTTTLAVAGRMS